jgi:3-methyladenine DNA glycosylase/8-oxoguanine DNA glycosylase
VIRDLYGMDGVTGADVERLAEAWRPYRMWAVVLLRMAWTRRQGAGVSYRRERPAG